MEELKKWMEVLVEGFKDCMTTIAGVEDIEPGATSTDPIKNMCGPILQVKVGEGVCLQIGMHANPETNQYMADLLEDDDDDDFLPDSDSSDAVGEIINVFAGYFARHVFTSGEAAVLTTPIFLFGQLDLPTVKDFFSQEIRMQDHKVTIFIGVVKVRKPR